MSSIWSSVLLGPDQLASKSDGSAFLRARLERAGAELLYVSIGVAIEESPETHALCATLAGYSNRINHLELSTDSSFLASNFIQRVFSAVATYPELTILSLTLERESEYRSEQPQLDALLEKAPVMFPMLQMLLLPSFYDAVPMLPPSFTFAHLHSLVLDGSREDGSATVALIVALLHCTPQLEALWFKHRSRKYWEPVVFGRELSNTIKGRSTVPLRVHLPRLTHLAVAVPGSACDLLYCLDAPALRYLHLDGSREPYYGETDWPEIQWSEWDTNKVQHCLKWFAKRCQIVRHFAVTEVYLAHEGWEWVLFGYGKKPPFPLLKSIALHGLLERASGIMCGFNDELLARFVREPSVPLRRLAFLNCNLSLRAEGDEWRELDKLGVDVEWWDAGDTWKNDWWTHDHAIDVRDSDEY